MMKGQMVKFGVFMFIGLLVIGLAGCDFVDQNKDNPTVPIENAAQQSNFYAGPLVVDDLYGVAYEFGDSCFQVNVPPGQYLLNYLVKGNFYLLIDAPVGGLLTIGMRKGDELDNASIQAGLITAVSSSNAVARAAAVSPVQASSNVNIIRWLRQWGTPPFMAIPPGTNGTPLVEGNTVVPGDDVVKLDSTCTIPRGPDACVEDYYEVGEMACNINSSSLEEFNHCLAMVQQEVGRAANWCACLDTYSFAYEVLPEISALLCFGDPFPSECQAAIEEIASEILSFGLPAMCFSTRVLIPAGACDAPHVCDAGGIPLCGPPIGCPPPPP